MAKSPSTTRKTPRRSAGKPSSGGSGARRGKSAPVSGKHLVIVESPAKAKTINRYLGGDFVVQASIGHVRDLPSRAPKGSKQPVPGVDLKNKFNPTYEVMPDKKKVMSDLKRAAKDAADVWFATDLDREGEAIAWHLAQELGIEPGDAKRVTFDAITKTEIQKAFSNPRPINVDMVNAQQARRILDRIVGYQVSPLLWKKVARGLSAGRVQSVAVRLVVEREKEIAAFVPDEFWKVVGRFSLDDATASRLRAEWPKFMATLDEKNNPPTLKTQNGWLADHKAIKAELVELGGEKFDLGCTATDQKDLTDSVKKVAEAIGLVNVRTHATNNPKGKGPERTLRTVEGEVDPACRYRVKSIETKRTTTRPSAPFITSTMQMAASSFLGFNANRTMRTAQSLYEGVNVPGEGLVGLITYMRTDSTHLSDDAIRDVRQFIGSRYGDNYLPEKPNRFESKESAQEAHEAIHPTDVNRHPDDLRDSLSPEQHKLYRLIWNRFVGCQMTPAQWDATAVLLERTDKPTRAVFRTTGRILVFDGFYRATGVPTSSEEQTLPDLREQQPLTPFSLDTQQTFTSPPSRYNEASLIKILEAEGIGRPSTYASIIKVIQDRGYVEQIDRRFHATAIGEVVTEKLIEGFPQLMDVGYTRLMEKELDQIAYHDMDWIDMLNEFYEPFSKALDDAHETMKHAKAETQPAPYLCPKCGISNTVYRFGKNGRFLSCASYPTCDYAAPVNREGLPLLPEKVNVACPEDGSPMVLRTGRFGKFLASVNYPAIKCVVNLDKYGKIKYPSVPAVLTDLICEKCGSPLNLRRGKRGPWLGCSTFPKCKGRMAWTKLEPATQETLEKTLEEHESRNPQVVVKRLDGAVIPEGTPIAELTLPGGVQELAIHPDAKKREAA